MRETIAKMVKLARLRFSQEEMDRFAKKAEHIIEYVEKLKQIKTEAIEPTSHALEVVNAFREDEIQRFPNPEKILAMAPSQHQNLFEVPKVIEE